jgi:hypothetical protein
MDTLLDLHKWNLYYDKGVSNVTYCQHNSPFSVSPTLVYYNPLLTHFDEYFAQGVRNERI